MPRISVVIPTFNREKIVENAIKSVLNQTYRDIEIIVCDDGSTDGTVDVVKLIQVNSDIEITLEVFPFNLGVSAARNKAIFLARGELIAFLDSDDTWEPDKLRKQIDFLDSNPEFIGVGCKILTVKDGEEFMINRFKTDLNSSNELFQLLYNCYITTSCFLVKKESLILAGLFDITLKSSEDRDLWWRLPIIGRIGLIDEPLIKYLKHDSSLSNELCSVTGNTYVPVVMKTVWFWKDELSKKEINKIISKAHLLVAYDSSQANLKIQCLKHAILSMVYKNNYIESIRLIIKAIIS